MFNRLRKFPILTIFVFSVLLFWGCTKLDTTTLGTELIPEVDNVNTFADTLDIVTSQGVFSGAFQDTTKLSLTEEYVVGKVNDPLMGQTDAKLFMQLKPPYYPYYIGKLPNDTIVSADSVVLCLSYKAIWGDSTQPLQFQVYQISPETRGEWDSLSTYRTINYAPYYETSISDPTTVDVRTLANYVRVGKSDSINNQIRIKLSPAFVTSLFSRDTSTNKSFLTDSTYKIFNNGFAVVANSGNSLVYVNLLETSTRLELHYKKRNAGILDTVYNCFYFNSGLEGEIIPRSAVANQIVRNRNPLPSGDQELYLQTTPGTFANLYIPGLSNISNKIIHRAEIQIQQIPDPINDQIYAQSSYLYLDLVDSGASKWKPIYHDLNPTSYYDPDFKTAGYPYFPSDGNVDINYFGGYLKKKYENGEIQSYYTFNVTRYIQQIATNHTMNYTMRLFPAHSVNYPQYANVLIPYKNPIAYGSVKVGGGANPIPGYRMRMRIIYSNIK